MTRACWLGLALVVVLCAPALAQEAQQRVGTLEVVPDFADLRTPDSAAFVLLGVSPTEIQRPTSPRQLAITVRNAFAGNGRLGIPDSFAVEASPFWLMSHDRLTLNEFVRSSFLEQLGQNATVSIATTTEALPGETQLSRTLLGLSARTHYESRENPCVSRVDDAKKQAQVSILAIVNQRYSSAQNDLVEQMKDKSEAELVAALEALRKGLDEEVAREYKAAFEELVARCEGHVGAHPGAVVDLAAARAR